MFAKLHLKEIEFDFVTMQHTAYFFIFLKSLIFEAKAFLETQKQYFKTPVMKKHWEQSGFLPSPSCSFQHALLSVSINFCSAKMVTFLVRSRACRAVVKKLSTLFDFAVHCKKRDFNISLDELLFIQVSKDNL